jgi:hypothetical protein
MAIEIHLTTYINTALAVLCFSLLIMGMSVKFGEISVLTAWADARSFANSMSTRAYTSADCFAYETVGVHYDSFSDEVVSQRRVFPGVIDARKFTQDRYFDCVQNYFFAHATDSRPLEVEGVDAVGFFIDFELMDLVEPSKLGDESLLSTREQLDITNREEAIRGLLTLAQWESQFFWVFGIILDLALGVVVGASTLGTMGIGISYAFVPADPATLSIIYTELIDEILEEESIYEMTVPVVIRYVDELGNIEIDHLGKLKTTIHYSAGGAETASAYAVS